jgi:glycosyltransferase involved in cell wall biosynthesis
MRQLLERRLRPHLGSIEFTGAVPRERIPEVLANTDVCVFPSRWENFPFVCLEAMAAARGIVGSSAGGMAEMLDGGRAGRLVPPWSPGRIAHAVLELLTDPILRTRLGNVARERVLAEYDPDRIGVLREASYVRAIQRRRARGPRRQDGVV